VAQEASLCLKVVLVFLVVQVAVVLEVLLDFRLLQLLLHLVVPVVLGMCLRFHHHKATTVVLGVLALKAQSQVVEAIMVVAVVAVVLVLQEITHLVLLQSKVVLAVVVLAHLSKAHL
jgi:hypothetical protein